MNDIATRVYTSAIYGFIPSGKGAAEAVDTITSSVQPVTGREKREGGPG